MPRIDKAVLNTRDVIKRLTLLHIREVPASNLGLVSGYSDRFSWLSLVPPGECPNSSFKLGPLLSKPFPIHLLPFYSTFYGIDNELLK
jgi:hypothetical protein